MAKLKDTIIQGNVSISRDVSVEGSIIGGCYNIGKTDTLLELGNGENETAPSNAFEVLKDGRAKVYKSPEDDDDIVRKLELTSSWDNFNLKNGECSGSLQQAGYTQQGIYEDFRHYAAAYGIAILQGNDSTEMIEQLMSLYTYEQLLGMIAQANFGGNTEQAQSYLYGMIDQVLTDQNLEFLPNEVNGPASTAFGVGNKVWSPISFVSGYKNILGRKGNSLNSYASAVIGSNNVNHGSHALVVGENLVNHGSHSFVGGRKSSIKIGAFEDAADKENCSKMFDALLSQDLLTSYDENTEWTWDGNHSDSDKNFVFNGYISEDAAKRNTVFGSSVTTGYGTTTFGDQNVNSGQYNFIHGLSNFVISNPGDPLEVSASKALGFHNFIYGTRNTIFSKNSWSTLFNHIVGRLNELRNASFSSILGGSNILGRELGIHQSNVHIQGHENNVNGISISVLGDSNTVKITDGKGLLVNGDSNTVGETIHYSTVIGDNNLVRNEKYATAIGNHLQLVEGKDHTQHRTALGKYNVDNKDAMFMIGNGTSDTDKGRSNVFEVLKDGRTKVYGDPTEANDVLRWQEKEALEACISSINTHLSSLEFGSFEVEVPITFSRYKYPLNTNFSFSTDRSIGAKIFLYIENNNGTFTLRWSNDGSSFTDIRDSVRVSGEADTMLANANFSCSKVIYRKKDNYIYIGKNLHTSDGYVELFPTSLKYKLTSEGGTGFYSGVISIENIYTSKGSFNQIIELDVSSTGGTQSTRTVTVSEHREIIYASNMATTQNGIMKLKYNSITEDGSGLMLEVF